MAKRFLPQPYDFASSSLNYTSGLAVGRPRKRPLPGSILADGYDVDGPLPAQQLNTFEALKADAVTIQAHNAMQRWGAKTLNPTNGSYLVRAAGPIRVTDLQQYYFLSAGTNFYDIHKTVAVDWAKYQAAHFANAVGINPVQIVGAKGGTYLVRVTGSDLFYFGALSTGALSTDSTFSGSGQTVDLLGFVGTAATGNGLLCLGGGMYYDTSGSWVAATFPAAIASPYEFAQNADASIVVFSCKVGTTPRLFYSTDQGVTWHAGSAFAASSAPGALCFSESRGVFLYLEDSSGQIFQSANGSSWTLAASGAPRSVASGGSVDKNALQQLQPGWHTMGACGPCVARLIKRADASGNASIGLAYTFDLAHWNYVALGDAAFFDGADLYTLDGRFALFALGTGGVFGAGDSATHSAILMSGLLEASAFDF